MPLLDSWTRHDHTGDSLDGESLTFPTYRKGEGPGVIVIHEVPGLIAEVIEFAEEVVGAGFTVVLPHLFGKAEGSKNALAISATLPGLCVRREFTKLATRETSPIAGWLRSLARDLHAELGGPGVGALGMCFTGGFALAIMVDESVAAPVLCQPSVPFAIGRRRSADVNLSPADLDAVRQRAANGCQVLGLQYDKDPATGTRFDTLTRELGDAFIRIEFPGRRHSTVTVHRQQAGVDRVLAFFRERLSA